MRCCSGKESNLNMKIVSGFALVTVVWALLTGDVKAADSPSAGKFGPHWKALLGEWKGETESGAGSGMCSFQFALSEHVIVRTNHAELPASGGGAVVHDDLMVVYPGATPEKARAIYFDNEGHTIEYAAEWSANGETLTFLSKSGPGPQFRLIYKKAGADGWTVNFEMAPPGQAGGFKTYTSGKLRRG
jgi:hypothetical protein